MHISINNIYSYLLGNYRYWLFYSRKRLWLMRDHIRQQITYRIQVMNSKCYNDGSCKLCGCMTTALQMANKPCDGLEYPPMMSKKKWDSGATIRYYNKRNRKHYIFIKTYSRYDIFEEGSFTITEITTPISY